MNDATTSDGFNWLAVLKDLAAGAPCDGELRARLNDRANRWPTCACGQLCASLPRNLSDGSPVDSELHTLGSLFCGFVHGRSWIAAIETFRQIEERADYLLVSAAA